MKENKERYIIGNGVPKVAPLMPYADVVCDFLDDFSRALRKDKKNKAYSDLVALAFWCRKNNIAKLKENFKYEYAVGRGLLFHITPSNVPINFAFSYFFGLLSGNSNIVRIPQKDYPQIKIICDTISQLLELEAYKIIKDMTCFVSYGRDEEITSYYSAICDGRIIWGGNETIQKIRQYPIKERAVEVVFADRYSFALIRTQGILEMSEEEIIDLANKFYNDTYLMDQNACSTPHLIVWQGGNEQEKEQAQQSFWDSVASVAKKYDLADIKAVDKYTDLCQMAIERSDIKTIKKYENLLYRIELSRLEAEISMLRGKYGMFYEYHLTDLDELAEVISQKVQTVVYVGIEPKEVTRLIYKYHLMGIDRIVPLGEALNMNVYWDGYDIIGQLTRSIEVR